MPVVPHPREPSAQPLALVRAQLERVLTSPTFARSERICRFLSFVVEEALAGRAETLKESVIANALYADDSGSDSVVRVDARRLRDKLREYYAEHEREPVVIILPKGSYAPRFEGAVAAPVRESESRQSNRSHRRVLTAAGVVILALIAVLMSRSRETTIESTPIPLTSYPGTEESPSLSPDGNFVAFAWRPPSGSFHNFVKAVQGEEVRQLTDGSTLEWRPAWSPDGRYIAFVRGLAGVHVISALGGQERLISNTANYATWTADSKALLVREPGPKGPHGIVRIELDTLERQQLTQPPAGNGEWRFEASPDGKNLALIRFERSGISDLHVMPGQGGEPKRITNWNGNLTGVTWTPDGRELIYSVRDDTGMRLWRIPADVRTPQRGRRLVGVGADASAPTISRPGPGKPARLAYVHSVHDVGLTLIDIGVPPKDGVFSSILRIADSSRIEQPGAWSRDGAKVAFNSNRDGDMGIWIANRDGSNLYKLTSGNGTVAWSPDGQMIAYDMAVNGNTDIYVKSVSGGQPRQLTSEPSIDGTPEWSPDGRWIYFTSNRANQRAEIWRMPSGGGAAVRITRNGGFRPRFSRHGVFLYHLDRFPSGMHGKGRLMRTPMEGGEEVEVLADVGGWIWDATDIGVVFLTLTTHTSTVELLRYEDHQVARLGRLPFRPSNIAVGWSVSRDGRWVLTNQIDRNDADLMLIDNFR